MPEETVEKRFTIRNKLGLHARAASLFVQIAVRFASDIVVEKNGQQVNGKSIMGILVWRRPKALIYSYAQADKTLKSP